jgi:hypothetical protein
VKQIIILLCVMLLLSCSKLNQWVIESYGRELERKKPKKTVQIEKVGLYWEIRERGDNDGSND